MNVDENLDLIVVLGAFTAILCAFGWYMNKHRLPEPRRQDLPASTRYSVESGRNPDGRYWAAIPALPEVFADGENEDEVNAKVSALALRVLADRLDSHETMAHSFYFHVGAHEPFHHELVRTTQATASQSTQQALVRMAEDTFETKEEAAQWLLKSHPMLDEKAPLQMARTEVGAERVKSILVAIKYGCAA